MWHWWIPSFPIHFNHLRPATYNKSICTCTEQIQYKNLRKSGNLFGVSGTLHFWDIAKKKCWWCSSLSKCAYWWVIYLSGRRLLLRRHDVSVVCSDYQSNSHTTAILTLMVFARLQPAMEKFTDILHNRHGREKASSPRRVVLRTDTMALWTPPTEQLPSRLESIDTRHIDGLPVALLNDK